MVGLRFCSSTGEAASAVLPSDAWEDLLRTSAGTGALLAGV